MTRLWAARHDPDDLNLLEDQRQGKGREKPLAEQHAENHDRGDQNDQRHKCGIGVQRMLNGLSTNPRRSRIR
jgi:hypothetical protein